MKAKKFFQNLLQKKLIFGLLILGIIGITVLVFQEGDLRNFKGQVVTSQNCEGMWVQAKYAWDREKDWYLVERARCAPCSEIKTIDGKPFVWRKRPPPDCISPDTCTDERYKLAIEANTRIDAFEEEKRKALANAGKAMNAAIKEVEEEFYRGMAEIRKIKDRWIPVITAAEKEYIKALNAAPEQYRKIQKAWYEKNKTSFPQSMGEYVFSDPAVQAAKNKLDNARTELLKVHSDTDLEKAYFAKKAAAKNQYDAVLAEYAKKDEDTKLTKDEQYANSICGSPRKMTIPNPPGLRS